MRPPGTFASPSPLPRTYPWHTDILAATFWVGEVLDPDAPDGSQRVSTYDSRWMERYGGCDGVWIDQQCQTEQRYEEDGWWPRHVEPRMNPFYLDLPFDDVNDDSAFAMRGDVIPWAVDPGYAEHVGDRSFSLMKNRWVQLRHSGRTCYGQIADAGPGVYDDAGYVFGIDDRRPVSRAFRGAGLDVSPALNGCLDLAGLDQLISRVDWRFVEAEDVPDGPWTRIVDDDPWVR
ncbi:hypothetical protein [Aeromicrobium phragmitis]|nr:hypothetical protein [Aeromicrobium phragmitis]